jgi:hypothetical protein
MDCSEHDMLIEEKLSFLFEPDSPNSEGHNGNDITHSAATSTLVTENCDDEDNASCYSDSDEEDSEFEFDDEHAEESNNDSSMKFEHQVSKNGYFTTSTRLKTESCSHCSATKQSLTDEALAEKSLNMDFRELRVSVLYCCVSFYSLQRDF